jgi:hypothetical protein
VETLGVPELTSEQTEELCSIAEEAARKYVLSRVPSKRVETLSVCAEIEGAKPLNLTIDVDVVLSPSMKDYDVQKLAEKAVRSAFDSAEKYLRELTCNSKT